MSRQKPDKESISAKTYLYWLYLRHWSISIITLIREKFQKMAHDFLWNLILEKLRENKVQHVIGSRVELTYGTELKLFNLLMLGEGEGSCLTVTK